MKKHLYIFFTISLLFTITACNFFNNQTTEAFDTIELNVEADTVDKSKEIEALMKTITDSAMANPAVYASAYNHMNEFHTKSERLLTELQHVRGLINDQVGESGDFEKMDEDTDQLLFNGDQPSENGARFIKAIQNYNLTASDQLFFFPEAEKMAQNAFTIEDVTNRDGENVEWLTYNFKGFPAIASKTKIAIMENDVKNVESTFLKALIEKPQF
ncbi:hypothetical protein BST92_02990 [Nonlabens arenilitoris]|uniref:Gliding motility-associated protein GldM N-terminal domain-containing protein n=1 Tax=Nonlabens arenilitoris TaxID=1217969 RepID=A0A2S7U8N9_9FLAO|nr:hypothetical protein [Nonlabens arenilitoris]PQJ30960.1 hypothetical protein BST92_02990 [Nonlabens arenilitoris]